MKLKVLIATIMLVLAFSSVSVLAADSPVGSELNNVKLNGQSVGKKGSSTLKVNGGTVKVSNGAIEVGKKLTLVATANDGNTFSKWVIDGEYEIVSGDLESGKLVIIPKSDVSIDTVFLDADGNELKGNKANGDGSDKSPKTGVATGVALLTLLGSAVCMGYSTKKSY